MIDDAEGTFPRARSISRPFNRSWIMTAIPLWVKQIRDIILLPFTVTCIVPYFVYDHHSSLAENSFILKAAGIVTGAGGLALFSYTVFLFNRIGRGTLAPWSPKQKLIVTGPYRYCRNPMISGVFFILAGEAMILNSAALGLWALTFFLINTAYFIFSEEPRLLNRFGQDYQIYKQHVPRWLPRLKPYRS